MTSDEKRLEPINDTLNPPPNKFGMPWYVILGILSLAVAVFMLPGCKIVGLLLAPERDGVWLVALPGGSKRAAVDFPRHLSSVRI
jgi:hypothetical protein